MFLYSKIQILHLRICLSIFALEPLYRLCLLFPAISCHSDVDRLQEILSIYGIDVKGQLNERITHTTDEIIDKYRDYTFSDVLSKLDSVKQLQLSDDGLLLKIDLSKFDIDARNWTRFNLLNFMVLSIDIVK